MLCNTFKQDTVFPGFKGSYNISKIFPIKFIHLKSMSFGGGDGWIGDGKQESIRPQKKFWPVAGS